MWSNSGEPRTVHAKCNELFGFGANESSLVGQSMCVCFAGLWCGRRIGPEGMKNGFIVKNGVMDVSVDDFAKVFDQVVYEKK